jgi:metallophosphoesterase superfamily enzyme
MKTHHHPYKARREKHNSVKERIFLLIEELDEFEQKQVAIFALSKTLTSLSFIDISNTCRGLSKAEAEGLSKWENTRI